LERKLIQKMKKMCKGGKEGNRRSKKEGKRREMMEMEKGSVKRITETRKRREIMKE